VRAIPEDDADDPCVCADPHLVARLRHLLLPLGGGVKAGRWLRSTKRVNRLGAHTQLLSRLRDGQEAPLQESRGHP
jgi:hypothetical protein